jgi:hypothetical protein
MLLEIVKGGLRGWVNGQVGSSFVKVKELKKGLNQQVLNFNLGKSKINK